MSSPLPTDRAWHIPIPLTPLVGRQREIDAVTAILLQDGVRVLTLTGPGGVGKTRLALRVAAEVADSFSGGVRMVSLASITEPDLVPASVAQALGIHTTGEGPLIDRIAGYLRDLRLLLVLDNFEHVVEAASWVAELLGKSPALTVFATSRVRLQISGEHEYQVSPLDLPDLSSKLSVEEALKSESVRLFVARARALKAGFALTPESTQQVAAICQRLDGLPLAIELAAARVKVLPPSALLARLDQRLPLLVGGGRDLPARHQTMRNAIAWTYALLSDEEQACFRRLSVFVGGCTIEAAEAVTGGTWASVSANAVTLASTALELLASLVDKSLLRHDPSSEPDGAIESRYSMLETIREYGLERLSANGEAEIARQRQANWYMALTEAGYEAILGSEHRRWLARLQAEHDNLRAILAWALDHGEAEVAQRLTFALCRFWHLGGHLSEGQTWAERALAIGAGTSRRTRAGALAAIAYLAWARGDLMRATETATESLSMFRLLGERSRVAVGLFVAGLIAGDLGEYDRARTFLEEGLAISTESDKTIYAAHMLNELGLVTYRQHSDLGRAEALLEESLQKFQELEVAYGVGIVLINLGRVARDRGDFARAAACYGDSLSLHLTEGDVVRIAGCLSGLAIIAAPIGEPELAARLFGATAALRDNIGVAAPRHPGQYEQAVAATRSALGTPAFDLAWSSGRDLATQEAVVMARSVIALAQARNTSQGTSARASALGLTHREVEVLRLLVEGRSNPQIAEALYISPRTASTHVTHILAKLCVTSRTEAAARAVRDSLL